ncbi:hypothetical protein HDU91_001905 [Kappamyces sp. JEL0680]|nr:hypothetical protein HDU91_001905 [Kappamyces sp. JEL0680]
MALRYSAKPDQACCPDASVVKKRFILEGLQERAVEIEQKQKVEQRLKASAINLSKLHTDPQASSMALEQIAVADGRMHEYNQALLGTLQEWRAEMKELLVLEDRWRIAQVQTWLQGQNAALVPAMSAQLLNSEKGKPGQHTNVQTIDLLDLDIAKKSVSLQKGQDLLRDSNTRLFALADEARKSSETAENKCRWLSDNAFADINSEVRLAMENLIQDLTRYKSLASSYLAECLSHWDKEMNAPLSLNRRKSVSFQSEVVSKPREPVFSFSNIDHPSLLDSSVGLVETGINQGGLPRITTEKLLSQPLYGDLFASARGIDSPFGEPDHNEFKAGIVDGYNQGFSVGISDGVSVKASTGSASEDSLRTVTDANLAQPAYGNLFASACGDSYQPGTLDTLPPEPETENGLYESPEANSNPYPTSLSRKPLSKGLMRRKIGGILKKQPSMDNGHISDLLKEEFGGAAGKRLVTEPIQEKELFQTVTTTPTPRVVSGLEYERLEEKCRILSEEMVNKGVDKMYLDIVDQLSAAQLENKKLQKSNQSSIPSTGDSEQLWRQHWISRFQSRIVHLELALQNRELDANEKTILSKEMEQLQLLKGSLEPTAGQWPVGLGLDSSAQVQVEQLASALDEARSSLSTVQHELNTQKTHSAEIIAVLNSRLQELESQTTPNQSSVDAAHPNKATAGQSDANLPSPLQKLQEENQQLRSGAQSLELQVQELSAELSQLSKVFADSQSSMQKAQQDLAASQSETAAAKESIAALETKLASGDGASSLAETRIKELEAQVEAAQDALRKKEEEELVSQTEMSAQLNALEATIEALTRQVASLNDEKIEVARESELRVSQVQAVLDRVKHEWTSSSDLLESQKTHNEALERKLQEAELREQTAQQRLDSLLSNLKEAEAVEPPQAAEDARELETNRMLVAELRAQLESSKSQLDSAQRELYEANRSLLVLQASERKWSEVERQKERLETSCDTLSSQLLAEKAAFAAKTQAWEEQVASLETKNRSLGQQAQLLAKIEKELQEKTLVCNSLQSEIAELRERAAMPSAHSESDQLKHLLVKNAELTSMVTQMEQEQIELQKRYQIECSNVKLLKKTLDDISNSSWW